MTTLPSSCKYIHLLVWSNQLTPNHVGGAKPLKA